MRVLTKPSLPSPRATEVQRARWRVPAVPMPGRVLDERARARRAGGPEDIALYRCQCGYAFEAEVTASVTCPRCGDSQAW